MLEKSFTGSKKYWGLLAALGVLFCIGFLYYLKQIDYGLGITGMGRDVSWGLYISQFTFLVGIAASAVTVVLPYYLHNHKVFGEITILGEFLAVSAVIMSVMFVTIDLGQPTRLFNMILHPTPSSVLFWDVVVLSGYLLLNILIGWTVLAAERKSVPPPKWIKPLIYLSIPWAISIHTVTAFIYAGLPGRGFWLTAIMAPRFLASAFASGPALLILLGFIVRKFSKFDPGKEVFQALAKIMTYALITTVFFTLMELFTAFYSQVPEHMHHFQYLFVGLDGHTKLVPWMWASVVLAILALVLLINPATRTNEDTLCFACAAVFFALWIEKGLGLVVTGFIPSPLEAVMEYTPTMQEVIITIGIWSLGFFILTVLYKIVTSVKEEIAG